MFDCRSGVCAVDIMTTEQAGKLRGVTSRHVSELCRYGIVDGAFKIGTSWVMLANTEKQKDERVTSGKWIGYKRKCNTVFDFSNLNTMKKN